MKEIYGALAAAQGAFSPIAKNRSVTITMKTGGKYNFRYADLEAVIAATRPALAANGLAVVQVIEVLEGRNVLSTSLVHSSGDAITSVMPVSYGPESDPKAYGALITYLRRYAYTSLLCVSADDDLDEGGDGIGATQQPQVCRQQAAPAQPAFYPQENFDKNFPEWKAAIEAGKRTPEQIIAMVESKAKLTDAQRKSINDIAQQKQG